MKKPGTREVTWVAVLAVALSLAGVGAFLASRFDSAIETATLIARPHEVQTQLERVKATLDALQDSVQDYIIDGAEGMRYQYEDAVRALGERVAELPALGGASFSADDLARIDHRIADVRNTSRAVIDARNAQPRETVRRLAEAGLAAVNAALRELDRLVAAQQDLLRTREQSLRRSVGQMYGGLVATAAIALCLLVGAVILVENDRRRGLVLREVLRSENERLETAVRERSATLAQANRDLAWFSRRALQIQEQERRSLALELHDQVGQELASLVHSLTRCEHELEAVGRSEALSAVQDSIEIARAAYGDVHNLALDLRPAMLDRLGLIPTLQWYARRQAKHSGCEISVEADAFPVLLPPEILIAAFRVAQEAVSNAVRHAKPRRIEIEARYAPSRIELQVRDDGAGFDPSKTNERQEPRVGLGLIGIRQRVQDVGGHVSIQSAPGSGTQIKAVLPLPEVA